MSNKDFEDISLITLKNKLWLDNQKIAGKAIYTAISKCKSLIESGGKISLLDLEAVCVDVFNEFDCTPTFFNYKGFPGKICTSVNHQLVHGIPNDYILKSGDIVSVDMGATYNGVIADSAKSFIFGEPKSAEHVRMLNVCEEALDLAIKSIEVGKRMGVIGRAISARVKNSGFGLINNYGGHGIDYDKPHAPPFVPNISNQNEGVRIVSGLSFAIEPMLVMGEVKTKVLDDKWTVVTPGLGCHFEHSITIYEDQVYVTTRE